MRLSGNCCGGHPAGHQNSITKQSHTRLFIWSLFCKVRTVGHASQANGFSVGAGVAETKGTLEPGSSEAGGTGVDAGVVAPTFPDVS